MRYIEPGQLAEIAFKTYPGKVYAATVESITPGSALGQISPTGQLPSEFPEVHGPLFVRLKVNDEQFANTLSAGATGEAAITPDVHWIIDPALNPEEISPRVSGLRARVSV